MSNILKAGDRELKFCESLIYYDGPLLSTFIDSEHNAYLVYWMDATKESNTWLVAAISEERLENYMGGKITLYDLLVEPLNGFLYRVVFDADQTQVENTAIQPSDIPENSLPTKDSIYCY